jgi:hypothetical protein
MVGGCGFRKHRQPSPALTEDGGHAACSLQPDANSSSKTSANVSAVLPCRYHEASVAALVTDLMEHTREHAFDWSTHEPPPAGDG